MFLNEAQAVSCSTGLQLSPRPRTCLGMTSPVRNHVPPSPPAEPPRGKLDKSHSTPAYELDTNSTLAPLTDHPIPESPTTPPVHKSNSKIKKSDEVELASNREVLSEVEGEAGGVETTSKLADIRHIDDDDVPETVNLVLAADAAPDCGR
ncbi:unnamed protein product, partial [Leptidea sinapis]